MKLVEATNETRKRAYASALTLPVLQKELGSLILML